MAAQRQQPIRKQAAADMQRERQMHVSVRAPIQRQTRRWIQRRMVTTIPADITVYVLVVVTDTAFKKVGSGEGIRRSFV